MLRATIALVALSLSISASAGLGAEDLRRLLPPGHGGFSPDPDGPHYYISTQNLTYIYDGGYLIYVDRGVASAMSQLYTRDSAFYQLVLHDMNSRENASVIVAYFEDLVSGSVQLEQLDIGDGGFRYSDHGMAYMYFSTGELFVTLEGIEGSEAAIGLAARDVLEKALPDAWQIAALCLAFLACTRKWHRRQMPM